MKVKYFRIIGQIKPFIENPIDISLLKNLGISSREVKCRKDCRCEICKRNIGKGETALKTVQRCDYRGSGYSYNAYCNECYQIEYIEEPKAKLLR